MIWVRSAGLEYGGTASMYGCQMFRSEGLKVRIVLVPSCQ
jgi:hypothetical protein